MVKKEKTEIPMGVNILWNDILMVSVVGVLDSSMAQQIMDSILRKIAETESKTVIFDILGVTVVDTAVANHLIKITQATKLMGCECIISGISPEVAQTLVDLGVELGDVTTVATLRNALQHAFEGIGLEVRKTERAPKKKGA